MVMDWKPIIAILATVAGTVLGWTLRGCGSGNHVAAVQVVDTVRVVEHVPEYIERQVPVYVKGKTIVFRDTVHTASGDTIHTFEAQPFTMQLDTVAANGDSISVQTSFPPPQISVAIKAMADTSTVRTRIVYIAPEREPWYVKPLYAAGGFVAGYGIRWMTEDSQTPQPITPTAAIKIRF